MQFDRVDDPGFVFIPTDLQYFIDFELKDSEKRALAAREGNILPREVPTSTLYSGHIAECQRREDQVHDFSIRERTIHNMIFTVAVWP
jgi:hypothetical protein